MKRIIFALSLTIAAASSYCQNKTTSKLINPDDKTPFPYDHSVYRGLQDKSGVLWFATSEGVYSYDGKSFANYKVMDGYNILPVYPPDMVEDIAEDKAGNTWFGAQGGVVRFDGKTFTGIPVPAMDPVIFFSSASIGNTTGAMQKGHAYVDVFADNSGNVWFYSGLDLWRYDEASKSAVQTGIGQYLKREVFPYDSIRRDAAIHGFYEDKKGNIWFTISGCSTPINETYCLNGDRINNPCLINRCKHNLLNSQDLAAHNKQISVSMKRITQNDGITSVAYIAALEDKGGNMWLGTWDSGVYRYDGTHLIYFENKKGLSNSPVGVIYEDRAGNIWFGTGDKNLAAGNGVFRYDGKTITHFTTKDGLCNTGAFRNNVISSIAEDNTGDIWFGGYGGVSRYNGKTFISLTRKDGFNEQPVNCIVKDNKGKLWIGTWKLGLYCRDGKLLTCYTEHK